MPPRCGCRLAASLWCTSPPRAVPTSAALVVVRNVLRLSSVVCRGLFMLVLLPRNKETPRGQGAPPPSLHLDIRRANTPTAVGERSCHAGLVASQFLDRCRGHGHLMQVEMRQLDVDDVPGLGVQLLAPRRVERPFGLLHQLVVACILPAREHLGILALGVEVALKKAIRIEAVGVAPYGTVKIALLPGVEIGYRIEGVQGHLETDAVPHLLDHLSTLGVEGDGSETDELDGGAHRPCLLEQGFGLVRVILQAPTLLQMPGVTAWIGLVEHVPLAVKHRGVDGLAVDGVRRRGAQALVLKWSPAEVEDHEETAEMPLPEVVFVAVALLETLHVGVGHVIDQMHLPG